MGHPHGPRRTVPGRAIPQGNFSHSLGLPQRSAGYPRSATPHGASLPKGNVYGDRRWTHPHEHDLHRARPTVHAPAPGRQKVSDRKQRFFTDTSFCPARRRGTARPSRPPRSLTGLSFREGEPPCEPCQCACIGRRPSAGGAHAWIKIRSPSPCHGSKHARSRCQRLIGPAGRCSNSPRPADGSHGGSPSRNATIATDCGGWRGGSFPLIRPSAFCCPSGETYKGTGTNSLNPGHINGV